ncbi:hypothetical protein L1S35_05280 [Flavobacterium sp. AS60]|uniref:hypothetical protein n=1 Tax=Flavobacterium anseongense TaxID=2910677 RepID=UPI001F282D41|nr:hypothetical protein [Flavobacterium sp. AS60]MCF6129077.1 hypothetical protein [Flavobacterium sp. AS60]
MKKALILILIFFSSKALSQNNSLSEYQKATILLQTNNIDSAYFKFKSLERNLPKNDTLYSYSLFYYTVTATELEKENRLKEKFDKSLAFGLEAFEAIEKGLQYFDSEFKKRKYFMMKNIVISNFGLENFSEAKKWKEKLYTAKINNELPEGIDQYFNFDYFTFEKKNIWGYEWFHELPKDRFGSSFSKVVYYVYSTDENGNDKDQLYRFQVLMFHASNSSFDYVLTKRLETAKNEVSGTLYAYTYKEDIDFGQLQLDIKEILKGNINPEKRKAFVAKK